MKTRRRTTKIVASVLALVGLAMFSPFAIAGNLEPDAPPGPTMKTLEEVEPRIAVQSLDGDANSLYLISQPGSYYLTGNITGEPNKCAIRIATHDVTLDLMGYSLIGGTGSGSGVKIEATPLPMEEVPFTSTIQNGTICNFTNNGLEALVYIPHFGDGNPPHIRLNLKELSIKNNGGNGITYAYQNVPEFPHFGTSIHLEKVTLNNNSGHGMVVDANVFSHMEDVSFTYNGGDGIRAGVNSYAHMEDVSYNYNCGNGAYFEEGSYGHMEQVSFTGNDSNGLVSGANCYFHMEQVSLTQNRGHGAILDMMTDVDEFSSLSGFNGGSGIIINGTGNLDKCSAVGNGGVGIQVGAGSTIIGGRVNDNESHGIQVSSNCRVAGNTCDGNGKGAIGIQEPAGIFATGNGNRIEGNHVVGNQVGIDVDGTDNLIIKNSAMNNSTRNYDVGTGNGVGPIIGTGDVDSSDNPHANYDF